MKTRLIGVLVAALIVTALPIGAELQNVQVGGELRIRYNYIVNNYDTPGMMAVRWPALPPVNWLPGRPVGDAVSAMVSGWNPAAVRNNGLGILSPYSWDSRNHTADFFEQRTRLNVSADFTQGVSAFIEFDSYGNWGSDFRSDYITGRDFIGSSDVQLFQAYVQAENLFDLPLRLRVGRQELKFGNEWLIGNKDNGPYFPGLSFDALRLTYANEVASLDAWAAQLADTGVTEQDGDVWFYGLYGSYMGIEDWTLDAYWLWLRDPRRLADTNFPWFVEWVEDLFGLDDYGTTNLHTIGLRAAGGFAGFDVQAEAAYQFGDADRIGYIFKPGLYGDNNASFSNWGGTVEVGYTFDAATRPRLYLGFDYYGGEDNRDINFWEWISPFNRPKASVSFNRLFSDRMYSGFIDLNNDMSNVWVGRGGVNLVPTESTFVVFDISYFETLNAFHAPVSFDVGRFRIPVAPALSFWTTRNDKDLGWQFTLFGLYNYTEDLSFQAQISHLLVGDGLTDGSFIGWNGLLSSQGTGSNDGTYITVETRLNF